MTLFSKRWTRPLVALLWILSVIGLTSAQSPSPQIVDPKGGALQLDFGRVFMPSGLTWSQSEVAGGQRYLGKSERLLVAVVALDSQTQVDNTTAIALVDQYLTDLNLQSEGKTVLLEAIGAPYPWKESLELRLKSDRINSIFVGSGSGRTLVVASVGPKALEISNSIAGSFKESFSVKRASRVKDDTAARIQSMLGTASTLLLLASSAIPIGVVMFMNRNQGLTQNPFKYGTIGLLVGLAGCLLIDGLVLSGLSWSTNLHFAQAFGATLTRFVFFIVVSAYLYHRFESRSPSSLTDGLMEHET